MINTKSSTTKVRPQMLKESLTKTKKLFHKTFKNLKKSLIFVKYQEQPTNPPPNPISPHDNMDNSKLQKWDAIEVKKMKKDAPVSPKAQTKKNKHISTRSISCAGCRESEGFKEDKNGRKHSAKKSRGSSFEGVDILARKMKDLGMTNGSHMDHVLDVEEVLHYYSRLSCPTYVEIVDKFFTDMQSELHEPQPSRSGSMRKLGSASAHGSMRSLSPL